MIIMNPLMLTTEDVLTIHGIPVSDFATSSDLISPPGVRSMALLESAVGRQSTSLGGVLKYPDPINNAATLAYGICCDHSFHNGNKRTALVAMLVHLDRNHLTLYSTSQNDLYNLMIGIADHSFGLKHGRRSKTTLRLPSNTEIKVVSRWLKERADRIRRGDKIISYRELRHILKGFNYYLENPKHNNIDIVRHETIKKGIITKRDVQVTKRIGSIAWPGETREVALKEIKRIREICRLREEDGVDSDSFYSYSIVVDGFVNRYRTVLRRLAKT
jgi:prophage maintenance system killer protein